MIFGVLGGGGGGVFWVFLRGSSDQRRLSQNLLLLLTSWNVLAVKLGGISYSPSSVRETLKV